MNLDRELARLGGAAVGLHEAVRLAMAREVDRIRQEAWRATPYSFGRVPGCTCGLVGGLDGPVRIAELDSACVVHGHLTGSVEASGPASGGRLEITA